jgi:hypothetical protein
MSKKKAVTKKPVTKKATTKKATTKKVTPVTSLKKNPVAEITMTATPLDEAALQAKYQECGEILEQVYNAITLALTISSEYDHKEPIEIVQYALDQYKEFTSLSPEEVATLQAESGDLLRQLEEAFPELEITEKPTQSKPKKELLN